MLVNRLLRSMHMLGDDVQNTYVLIVDSGVVVASAAATGILC
jgi:hypothetical protein